MSVNSTLDPAEERFSELEHRGNKFPRTRHGKKSENSGERDSVASLLPVSAPLRSSTGSSTVRPGESLRHGPAPHEGRRRPPTLPAPSPTHTRSATVSAIGVGKSSRHVSWIRSRPRASAVTHRQCASRSGTSTGAVSGRAVHGLLAWGRHLTLQV